MTDNEIIQQYKKYEPIFGSWYIKRFIGEGGFARVFEITRTDFGKEYTSALKIITVSKSNGEIDTMKSEGMSDEDIRQSLYGIVEDTVREIQLMYELRGNGNIVGYEDHAVVEHEDGRGWDILIKMEFLTTLSSFIRQQNGQLAKRDVIKLGIDICKALEACQKYNIIHRDIKADNIFVSKTGDFKLGDFGIARVLERKDMELSKKGTFTYMAPEVYKGQTYTSSVDIYSLGIVLYRLMNNNRAPFLPPYPTPISLDDRDRAMMLRMSGERLPKPNQVSRSRLTEIVLKACAYRPEERYSSPGFMRQELEAIYLSQEEMTTDEWIMIYEEQGKNRTASSSSSPGQGSVTAFTIPTASTAPEPTGATEVLREDGATEILRGDATEVLREEDATEVLREQPASAPVQSMLSRTTKICIKCGGTIDHKFIFCPICGASQNEEPEQPKEVEQRIEPKKPERSKKSAPSDKKKIIPVLIGGICTMALMVTVFTVVYTMVFSLLTGTSSNTLMSDMVGHSDGTVLGSNIQRDKIITVTFLDSLDAMPDDAWDVAEWKSGKVKAWVETRNDGYYDLFISAKGGVMADTYPSWLFADYTSVEQIQFNGNFDTSKAKSMSGMFSGCAKLTSVDVSGFDTSNVTDMYGMFSGCAKLTSVDVSGFDTSNVTDMYGMFNGCERLISVDVSGFDTSNVTNTGGMFRGCTNLTSVNVSNFTSDQIRVMEIPESVNMSPAEHSNQEMPSSSPESEPSATTQPPASSEPEPERPDQDPPPDSSGSSESRPDRPDRPDRPEQ